MIREGHGEGRRKMSQNFLVTILWQSWQGVVEFETDETDCPWQGCEETRRRLRCARCFIASIKVLENFFQSFYYNIFDILFFPNGLFVINYQRNFFPRTIRNKHITRRPSLLLILYSQSDSYFSDLKFFPKARIAISRIF